ncbi:L-ascorbate oxidase-like protein [Pseudovirgaria hyperparasitica]|uniref:L-ascorbate oxidase-like protein n=1 Tax=Pseudovirgaria hyperparasitica TaxID=470096 RepID=A0A6A6WMT4_9PEZI|nr:L-ascorbate oxidase-like protein [Pseudovirgaria hyperparasitica]KAF2763547.1 L-ascorbate oxidase-like protein [Pseudovirgaria hyperparasitica]
MKGIISVSSFLLSAVLVLCSIAPFVAAGHGAKHGDDFQPDYILRITEDTAPVACQVRKSVLVNGTSPGPEIRLKPGSTTWIRVYNDMESLNTTMHWHGLAQRVAPFSDGSPLATQWPIPAKHFFDYEIYAEEDDAGTYFYHSHVGIQALTAAGPLIVEDCGRKPYDYDEERVFMLTDYFNKTDEVIEGGLQGVPFTWSGETNAILLNGKGVPNTPPTEASECSLPVIDVRPGKTYRFRFIGGTALSHTLIAFEGHPNLTIINVEGHYTEPHVVDRMQLGSGNRFDILFSTKSAADLAAAQRSSYFIQFESRDRPTVYRGYAILRYEPDSPLPKAPAVAPLTLPNATYDWAEYALQPLYPRHDFPALEEVTRRIILNTSQIQTFSQHLIWKFSNNYTWTEAVYESPLLIDIYKSGEAAVPSFAAASSPASQGYDPISKAFPAKQGEVIEVVFQNTGSLFNNGGGLDVHPFHAHGQHVFDIGSGNGTYDPVANEAKIKERHWRPVERDTTMLYRYGLKTTPGGVSGWRAWRVRLAQPGVWMVHCHTLQHMIMGMQTVWVIGDAAAIRSVPIEYAAGYLEYGGSSYGNETFSPIVWEQYDGTGSCAQQQQQQQQRHATRDVDA